jgi:RNA polymerase sigma factor (sigma-70 family)
MRQQRRSVKLGPIIRTSKPKPQSELKTQRFCFTLSKPVILVNWYVDHFMASAISDEESMFNPLEIVPGEPQRQAVVPDSDALLRSYFATLEEAQAELTLGVLLWEHARPLIQNIVSTNLRFSTSYTSRGRFLEDLEDLVSGVTLQLLKRLRGLRESPDAKRISSFRDYVAVAAYNACYEYLRQRNPERTRLKDKLRYILTRREGLALWEAENKRLCGLANWRVPDLLQIEKSSTDGLLNGIASAEAQRLKESARTRNLVELVEEVFKTFLRPMEFNQLVSLVAELVGVKEAILVVDEEFEGKSGFYGQTSSLESDPATRAEMRSQLSRMWLEIGELPLTQRRALMLGLRDKNGSSMTVLLADIRIASLQHIAEVLAMLPESLASLWKELPLDDLEIAKLLSITRDQVIHQRQSARRRLARRMQLFQ